ncbi:MAG: IS4 family transposase, partial [Candidatus Brocadiaceae bacterium]|nr:IS4 family transposase [Candidatus Brocadiaceae bacterium]
MRDCVDLQAQMPKTTLVNVMDREADFFELFDEQRRNGSNVDLLVRAKHDRKTTGEQNLFETIKGSSVQSRINIKVPRQSARPKKSKQKARAKLPSRTAEVSVRYIRTELSAPSNRKEKDPVQIWIVHVSEENPPADTKGVEWFLLTTFNMKSVDDALSCVKWYCLRWRIEDWHRVLKFGCGVKKIAHKTAERQKRAIAINMVIAWRIMLMTLLGRETPELPAEVLFSDIEIQVLAAYAKKKIWYCHIV